MADYMSAEITIGGCIASLWSIETSAPPESAGTSREPLARRESGAADNLESQLHRVRPDCDRNAPQTCGSTVGNCGATPARACAGSDPALFDRVAVPC